LRAVIEFHSFWSRHPKSTYKSGFKFKHKEFLSTWMLFPRNEEIVLKHCRDLGQPLERVRIEVKAENAAAEAFQSFIIAPGLGGFENTEGQ